MMYIYIYAYTMIYHEKTFAIKQNGMREGQSVSNDWKVKS